MNSLGKRRVAGQPHADQVNVSGKLQGRAFMLVLLLMIFP
jgi:hypothetical protein